MSAIHQLGLSDYVFKLQGRPLSETQRQTSESFGYKWSRQETYVSDVVQERTRKWLLERYCGNDGSTLERWLDGGRKIILDAGCGSGFTAMLLFGNYLRSHDYLGIDISNAMNVGRKRFEQAGIQGEFIQGDISTIPIPPESIDIIYSEGVLHHTDSVRDSLLHLSSLLKKGGRFLFYVYLKKGAVREFTDDHIRKEISSRSDEEAWNMILPLTKLGQALGKTNMEITVPEDIPYLGIPKGKIPLQRLFYWYFCKMFYDPDMSIPEMNHINFDWFRPLNCHRHSEDEIVSYCAEAGLAIERKDIQQSGITIVAVKA